MSIFSSNRDKESSPNPGYVPPTSMPQAQAQPQAQAPQQSAPVNTNTNTPNNTNPFPPAQNSNMTVISEGAILDGQIKIEGDIRIEGVIKGSVTSKGKVVMSKSGKVEGDIICQHADISGHVTGKLRVADILMLKGNALVEGDINTGKLIIESGVKFNGHCSMGAIPQSSTAASSTASSASTPTPPKISNTFDLNAK